MNFSRSTCSFCKIAAYTPDWWVVVTKPWKRWVLLFMSLLFFIGVPAFVYSLVDAGSEQATTFLFVLSGVLWSVAFLGIIVSLAGCNACTSKALW